MKTLILILLLFFATPTLADEKSDLNQHCLNSAGAQLKNKTEVCQCVAENLISTGHYSAPVVELYRKWTKGELSEEAANRGDNFLYLDMASKAEYYCVENPKYKFKKTGQ